MVATRLYGTQSLAAGRRSKLARFAQFQSLWLPAIAPFDHVDLVVPAIALYEIVCEFLSARSENGSEGFSPFRGIANYENVSALNLGDSTTAIDFTAE